jgi:hypothetical protein
MLSHAGGLTHILKEIPETVWPSYSDTIFRLDTETSHALTLRPDPRAGVSPFHCGSSRLPVIPNVIHKIPSFLSQIAFRKSQSRKYCFNAFPDAGHCRSSSFDVG